MPFGSLQSSKRLGIANVQVPNASEFGVNVLRLPSGFFVYQQQLVHNIIETASHGGGAAEWCSSADNESSRSLTLRQVSPHDSVFAWRNLSDSPNYSFNSHRSSRSNQLYFVNNEPTFTAALETTINTNCSPYCNNARNRDIDSFVSGCFSPSTQFWETGPSGDQFPWTGLNCTPGTNFQRIRAKAMAFVYLRMKRLAESMGRDHVVLPPSSANARLDYEGAGYWTEFFDAIHTNGVTFGYCSEQPISLADLKVLHVHVYGAKPSEYPLMSPLQSVGHLAVAVRKGADWYRNRYNGGADLPLDILLSETGSAWNNPASTKYAGGWPDFSLGLAWWNTWLSWLLRTGPRDCKLAGWSSGTHTIHAGVHEADSPPMATVMNTNSSRNQWYFNSDVWTTYQYTAQTINFPGLNVVDGGGGLIYERSVSVSPISWGSKTWRMTPFGACFAVWSRVGTLPVTGNLNTGWVSSTQSGVIGTASVSLPAGWSTVYFPVIKNQGVFPGSTQFFVRWVGSGSTSHYRGVLAMDDFDDSAQFNNPIDPTVYPSSQYVYMSMVYPVVCYASTARTVTIELSRNITGPEAWLGPPVVLPIVCSWFTTQ